jgi:hypothetical protein
MTTIVQLPATDEQAFSGLLSELKLERSAFKVKLTQHSPPTYGPTVSTVKIVWNGLLTIEYGATDSGHWVEQFRKDWESGLLPEAMSDLEAEA